MSIGDPIECDPHGHGRSRLMEYNRFADKTDRIGFIFLCGEWPRNYSFVSDLAIDTVQFQT
ncbi:MULTISPECIES: hypothetical protein [unclassified Paenibacillus]|uniref:hypothetical protein n=1 Tax=unclassified Paenibacillus TaxID=185978 RepID=UPI00040021B8|nr:MULTISPECIES: hypothetical protein [unclassified Paenibacillus]KGP82545.1 hypothetical protein P364_0112735 [Paenibacillus sp. MAEPY2]KGP89163.1 hypothetical protein P363_0102250 [Paenibacillus sp. MAEPY1]